MKHLGVSVIFHPFFWTWDLSWQGAWGAWSIEIGPLALRIFVREATA